MERALGCIRVDESNVAVTEKFGKFSKVLQPGFHCFPWCLGYQLAGNLSMRPQTLDLRCESKTKDNVLVTVVAFVEYRAMAEKVSDAFYKLSDAKKHIQAYAFDVIRASVPSTELDSVFEHKNDLAKTVKDELVQAMSAYCYEIVEFRIVDLELDVSVKKAMNEIIVADKLMLAANKKAEEEKILLIKRAEVEAESKYQSELGIIRLRRATGDALRESVLAIPGTTSKDVMDMVLMTQYSDTMKEIGASSRSSAVFIPHGPGVVKDVASQIRDGLLQGQAMQR